MMNRQLLLYSTDKLKKLLSEETTAFNKGLDDGINFEELQRIRTRIKDICKILTTRVQPGEKGNLN